MRRRDCLYGALVLGASRLAGEQEADRKPAAQDAGAPASGAFEPFPGDMQRPRYHFLPPRNWMNDPNGLIYHRGLYHLFYQHNPGAAVWGNMHWGHAVSRDLLQWQNLPFALAPTPGGYDKDGVFSGCAVDTGDKVAAIYTGTQPEVQAVAFAEDPQLGRWTKYAGNPVIAKPPEGLDVTGFRDPFVWREDREWLMALGSGIKGKGGCVLLYRSTNLLDWDYLHPLIESDDPALGTMWECPNFFPLGDKHVLLLSPIPLRKSIYLVGSYEGRRFRVEKTGSLDEGGHYYAPQAFLDSADRRVVFGWSWEGRKEEAQVSAGWAGVQTLPRVLSLAGDGSLAIHAHPICQRLVRFGKSVKSLPIGPELNQEMARVGIRGDAGRANITIEPGDAKEIVVWLRASGEGREQTGLRFRPKDATLTVDRSKSSVNPAQDTTPFQGALRLGKKELLQLTIYLDRSMVEVYANQRLMMTTRIYPELPESMAFRLESDSAKAMLREFTWHPIQLRTS